MSAERLREAAVLLRERALMATPGPWRDSTVGGNRYGALVADAPHPDRRRGGGWQWDANYGGCLVGESHMSADRRYLATVHPGVGLALADWLDLEAMRNPEVPYPGAEGVTTGGPILQAVRVADLILGSTS